VDETLIVGTVLLQPHRIDAARHADRKKVEKHGLILLQARCPQGIRGAGDLVAHVSRAAATEANAFVPSQATSLLRGMM
jgi:hypothetical protein